MPNPPTSLELNKLMKSISFGNATAFSVLYDRLSADIFEQCKSRLGSSDQAEDATQDIFIKIWDKSGSYRPRKGNAEQWITAIVRNHCVDLLRKAPQMDPEETSPLDLPSDDGIMSVETKVDSKSLLDRLGNLAPGAAEIISLRFLHQLSFPEISRITGIPEPTAKSRSRRGLQYLRRENSLLQQHR